MKICPAILTNSKEVFLAQLSRAANFFEHIDIDLNAANDNFDGMITVDFEFALIEVSKYPDISFTFHLMYEEPSVALNYYESSNLRRENINFILHQESGAENYLSDNLKIGVAVKAESQLNSIEYYQQFPEVQLMTIETGVQGNSFKPEILDRVEWLRTSGFTGTISLDGSVNTETARLIASTTVNKVSVGSYFSNSTDIKKSLKDLEAILNS